jgi:hypothetical protein
VIVGLVAGANRARVFPQLRRGGAAAPAEEEWPLLRFEPDLFPEQAG